MRVPDTIAIELEAAGNSRSTFRLRVNSTIVGGNLTAAQAQLLVGDILERIALPNRDRIGREIGAAEGELEPRGGQMFRVATMMTAWRVRLAAMSATLRQSARRQFPQAVAARVVACGHRWLEFPRRSPFALDALRNDVAERYSIQERRGGLRRCEMRIGDHRAKGKGDFQQA